MRRGRRTTAPEPTGRRPRPADPAVGAAAPPPSRASSSPEPPTRRSIRDGIGWLPPESPDLFSGGRSRRGRGGTWGMQPGGNDDEERLRHAIASEALTELSRLSSYSPTTVNAAPASSLTRRTPAAATRVEPVTAPPSSPPPVGSVTSTATGAPTTFTAKDLAAPLFGGSVPERFAEPGEPSAVTDGTAPPGLPTRARPTTDAAAPAPALPPRPRTADGVRSTLTGFTDGARRGRGIAVPEHEA
ncbi:MAG: hypothetical protein ACKVZ6_17905, partial [Kineosporiaceae bacterium]